jgi:hypothetical protein
MQNDEICSGLLSVLVQEFSIFDSCYELANNYEEWGDYGLKKGDDILSTPVLEMYSLT